MTIKNKTTLYTVQEAPEKLNLSIHSVRKYIERERIKPSHRAGTVHLMTEADLAKFEKTRKGPGNPSFKKK